MLLHRLQVSPWRPRPHRATDHHSLDLCPSCLFRPMSDPHILGDAQVSTHACTCAVHTDRHLQLEAGTVYFLWVSHKPGLSGCQIMCAAGEGGRKSKALLGSSRYMKYEVKPSEIKAGMR